MYLRLNIDLFIGFNDFLSLDSSGFTIAQLSSGSSRPTYVRILIETFANLAYPRSPSPSLSLFIAYII